MLDLLLKNLFLILPFMLLANVIDDDSSIRIIILEIKKL